MSTDSATNPPVNTVEFIAVLDIEPVATVGSRNAADSPDATKAVVDFYIDHGVIEAAQAHGLREGILAERGPLVRVVSSWPDAACYQAWLDAPERVSLIRKMGPLVGRISGTTARESRLRHHLGNEDIVMHRVVSSY